MSVLMFSLSASRVMPCAASAASKVIPSGIEVLICAMVLATSSSETTMPEPATAIAMSFSVMALSSALLSACALISSDIGAP